LREIIDKFDREESIWGIVKEGEMNEMKTHENARCTVVQENNRFDEERVMRCSTIHECMYNSRA